jgi:hypothetical protein
VEEHHSFHPWIDRFARDSPLEGVDSNFRSREDGPYHNSGPTLRSVPPAATHARRALGTAA